MSSLGSLLVSLLYFLLYYVLKVSNDTLILSINDTNYLKSPIVSFGTLGLYLTQLLDVCYMELELWWRICTVLYGFWLVKECSIEGVFSVSISGCSVDVKVEKWR